MHRHVIIPDVQCTPGTPTSHLVWAGRAIAKYRPTHIIVLGDWWEMASLSTHGIAGSASLEGTRYTEDVEAGNQAFREFVAPWRRAVGTRWNPACHFLFGNHEHRITRTVQANPRIDSLRLDDLKTPGFRRHPFLKIVTLDGIAYAHYFQSMHSRFPIGGSIQNRLAKIGRSFVQGHEQGFRYDTLPYPGGVRRHGLVCGSFYQHAYEYRGPQNADEWRGIVVLNEVARGDFAIMPLTLDYLRRKYG